MSINGTALTGPLKMPVAFIDLFAGHQLKEGLLIALLNRSKHGKGALVSVSLEESAIASLANQASTWLNTGVIPQQQGSLHPVIAPYGETFSTLDKRHIVLAVGTDQQFRKLCGILGIQGVADSEEFSTNPARVVHRKKLGAILSEAFLLRNADELTQELAEQDIPAGLVKNMQQLFETTVAQEMVLEQAEDDEMVSRRVRTAVFNIETNP
jgi:crotonobetainyl-CoA:carnitine CoA-transferase CaiB-like acyl-CoA transferase